MLWGRSMRGNLAFEQLDDINVHKHMLVSTLIVIYMCLCKQFSNSGCHNKEENLFLSNCI